MTREEHLLSQDEFDVIARYVNGISRMSLLTYTTYMYIYGFILYIADAQYLLVRLCLRKEDKWHRLSDLKYEKQIGSGDAIRKAIDELCFPQGASSDDPIEDEFEGREIIDLTSDDEPTAEFAEDDSAMTMKDLLGCLTLDELKDLAKQFKVKTKGAPNVRLLRS